jgi:hypothetical protein
MATANVASVPAVAASTSVVQAATLGAAAPELKKYICCVDSGARE